MEVCSTISPDFSPRLINKSRNAVDKRARNAENQAKRRKLQHDGEEYNLPVYATRFSKEEIEGQEKKPKRKVAVMIGYSGSGYKGMQLNHHEKTIEGDLFVAFVAAGAISKANADDPKKSSLVRCARTDKGVHAVGNVISLKLIVEDPDIVEKINKNLSSQIRVWDVTRTNGSFSAYQFCDSRIYEYLIPTHCFLPPHPRSFLGKKLVQLAEEANDLEGFSDRQKEVADAWAELENEYVHRVIEEIDPSIREATLRAFYEHDFDRTEKALRTVPEEHSETIQEASPKAPRDTGLDYLPVKGGLKENALIVRVNEVTNEDDLDDSVLDIPTIKPSEEKTSPFVRTEEVTNGDNPDEDTATTDNNKEPTATELALRKLKAAHIAAKKAYRIHPTRLDRVRSSLSRFVGSYRFHNYTIERTFKNPSVFRLINSFKVGEQPIIIGDTEWLSLKVHGQSFMMHQIRKMVSMAALVVRCGCHEGRFQDTYEDQRFSIPKAPALGLLLERPIFDVYNEKLEQLGRDRIDFSKYEKEMKDFKQREIYERIFREEEKGNVFHTFFEGLDGAKSPQLLWLSSLGLKATKREFKDLKDTQESVERVEGEDDDHEDGQDDN